LQRRHAWLRLSGANESSRSTLSVSMPSMMGCETMRGFDVE
jgi:hypothetical protein